MKLFLTMAMMAIGLTAKSQVNLTSSTLPILVIETVNWDDIPNEPKIDAHLGIIWNNDSAVNQIGDPYNGYDGLIGIEKRGSSSQALFPKVGYAFETRNADGSNNNVSLLGFPAENDWVLNGPYSDKSLIRNALAYILAGRIMEYAPRVKFCEVLLNGDYRGVYILTEKIKRDENRVNISTLNPDENTGDDLTGGYILKFDKYEGSGFDGFFSEYPAMPGGGIGTFFQYHYPKFDEITDEQKAYIQGYISGLEDVLQSPQFADPVTGYRQYFDMPSFYEFLFIQEIGKNVDGYRLSSYFFKDKESVNDKVRFGPIWDFNLAFGNVDYCFGPGHEGWAKDFNDFCPGDFWAVHFWWDRMWSDPAFKSEMKSYWQNLRTDELSDAAVLQVIDSLANMLEVPSQRNFTRWPILGEYVWPNGYVGGDYEAEIGFLTDWTINRLEWLDGAMDLLSPVSFNQTTHLKITVSPNPFSDFVNFNFDNYSGENFVLNIFNAQGNLLVEQNNAAVKDGILNMELDLPCGLYFYKIKFENGEVASGKLVRN